MLKYRVLKRDDAPVLIKSGDKKPTRSRVIATGTLPEVLPKVRERWGQDGVSDVLDQALFIQGHNPSSSDY